jgi:phthiocerol/phenolphthiocerol synthesis type-I polyketide synthase C
LPASLHFDEPNPDIAFADLNLTVAGAAIPLERRNGTRFAGVSSFGFGGTNAHVILADAPKPAPTDVTDKPAYLAISAHTKAALAALSAEYSTLMQARTRPRSSGSPQPPVTAANGFRNV